MHEYRTCSLEFSRGVDEGEGTLANAAVSCVRSPTLFSSLVSAADPTLVLSRPGLPVESRWSAALAPVIDADSSLRCCFLKKSGSALRLVSPSPEASGSPAERLVLVVSMIRGGSWSRYVLRWLFATSHILRDQKTPTCYVNGSFTLNFHDRLFSPRLQWMHANDLLFRFQ